MEKKILSQEIHETNAIARLIEEFHKLPGVGPKSAQRITYHLLRAPDAEVKELAEAILSLKQETKLCSICYNITDADPCRICSSAQRDKTKICIIEQPHDIDVIEHTGAFKGLYHVLHGAISPTDGIGTDSIRIKEVVARLKDGIIEEVILATNTNLEGEQTAMYLNRIISPTGIKVTRIARGLPFGTELEYADDLTLTRALQERTKI
jgi:recombination protein RecR